MSNDDKQLLIETITTISERYRHQIDQNAIKNSNIHQNTIIDIVWILWKMEADISRLNRERPSIRHRLRVIATNVMRNLRRPMG